MSRMNALHLGGQRIDFVEEQPIQLAHKDNKMENADAQAEYDKLTGLLKGLREICENNKIPDEAVAALGVGNSEVQSNLEGNLRVKRLKVLSELVGISKAFGGR